MECVCVSGVCVSGVCVCDWSVCEWSVCVFYVSMWHILHAIHSPLTCKAINNVFPCWHFYLTGQLPRTLN